MAEIFARVREVSMKWGLRYSNSTITERFLVKKKGPRSRKISTETMKVGVEQF